LKKPAASKRATLPRAADYAKSFRKDWARLYKLVEDIKPGLVIFVRAGTHGELF
jgi:hypothetical protein